jgi:protein ImuA
MEASDTLAGLRRSLAAIAAAETGFGDEPARFTFGVPEMDRAVGGGLPRGTLHDVYAARVADGPAAFGFGLALMLRATEAGRKIVWVRQDMTARELGELYPPGLAEFGADPSAILTVRVNDALAALRAGNEALHCAALGAVAIEIWGTPKALDLTATRRLARAAERAGVTVLLLHVSAEPMPSAALTRWSVRTSASRALAAGAPGASVFEADLLRHRAGFPPRSFRVEWDRDECVFREPPLSGSVAAFAADRPAAPVEAPHRRRAG